MYQSKAEALAAFNEMASHFEALEAHIEGNLRDDARIVAARIKSCVTDIHLMVFGHAIGTEDPDGERERELRAAAVKANELRMDAVFAGGVYGVMASLSCAETTLTLGATHDAAPAADAAQAFLYSKGVSMAPDLDYAAGREPIAIIKSSVETGAQGAAPAGDDAAATGADPSLNAEQPNDGQKGVESDSGSAEGGAAKAGKPGDSTES